MPKAYQNLSRSDKKPHLEDHFAVIYFVGPTEDGPIKIGITTNLSRRISAIQNGCWEPLMVFGVRVAVPTGERWRRNDRARSFLDGALAAERLSHDKLEEFELRLIGEWFDVSAADAIRTVEKCGRSGDLMVAGLSDILGAEIDSVDADVLAEHRALTKGFSELSLFMAENNERMRKAGGVD